MYFDKNIIKIIIINIIIIVINNVLSKYIGNTFNLVRNYGKIHY